MRRKNLKLSMLLLLAALAVLIALPSAALANTTYFGKIPATGYEKSCNLCHTSSIPALNAFGTKFKATGYDFSKLATSTTTTTTKPATTTTTTKPATTTTTTSTATKPAAPAPVGITEGKFAGMLTSIGYYTVATKPEATLTRQKAAEYLATALGIANIAKDMPIAEAVDNLKVFKDAKDITASGLIAAVVKNGLIKGYVDGTFKPKGVVTEAVAKILVSRADLNKATIAALPNYVGSKTCKTCHPAKYQDWKGTGHSRHVIDLSEKGSAGAPLESQDFFKAEDALYAVGGMTQLRFLSRGAEGDYFYLPASYSLESRTFSAYPTGPNTNWSTSCTTCHTLGFNKASKQFVERGISCESCHGAGLAHVQGGGDKTKITKNIGTDMCKSCHGGQVSDLEAMGTAWARIDAATGQPKERLAHLNKFKVNLETNATYGDACIECHSGTAFLLHEEGKPLPKLEDFKTGALKDDRYGITCAVCHDPHKRTNEYQLRLEPEELCIACHTAEADITSGKSPKHPQKELFEGQVLVNGKVTKTFASGHNNCATCHMANGNHKFKPGTPTITLNVKGKDVVFTPCASCHKDVNGEETMTQARFDAIRAANKARYDAITADWNAVTARKTGLSTASLATYNDDYATYSLLKTDFVVDGSLGVHNPAGESAMMDKLEKDLKAFKAELGL
ncbi:MAG: multiheme c-type cytochrome [Bacillota bacterium]